MSGADARIADPTGPAPAAQIAPDPVSHAWLERLRSDGQTRDPVAGREVTKYRANPGLIHPGDIVRVK